VTSGRRRDATFLLICAAVASAIGLVIWLSELQERAEAGRPVAWWEPAIWEGSSVLVLLLLAPFVMALTRRVEPLARPWPLVIGAHLGGALAFSVVHVAGMGVLRAAAYHQLGKAYPALGPLQNFLYEFRKDLLVYGGLVALYVLWRRMTPTDHSRPALETIEVKDGARRRFVAAADVLWIEAAGNYVELHTAGQAVLHRAPLSELESELGGGFVRVHRSRLVRRGAVAVVKSRPSGDYVIRLTDGREVAGSRRYRRPLLEP
jgi:hypothetical protein